MSEYFLNFQTDIPPSPAKKISKSPALLGLSKVTDLQLQLKGFIAGFFFESRYVLLNSFFPEHLLVMVGKNESPNGAPKGQVFDDSKVTVFIYAFLEARFS